MADRLMVVLPLADAKRRGAREDCVSALCVCRCAAERDRERTEAEIPVHDLRAGFDGSLV